VKDVTGASLGAPGVVGAAPAGGGSAKVSYKNAVDDAHQFVFDRTARVNGLPQTSPQYDELIKPSIVPVPAACVASKTRCACYTQQGTPMQVGDSLCMMIVKNGYFQDFDPDGKNGRSKVVSAGALAIPAPSGSVVPGAAAVSPGGSVTVIGDSNGYGVLGKRGG
jgi:zona occludens toxin